MKTLALLFIIFFYSQNSFTYIDPGTGSIVFGFLGSLLLGATAFSSLIFAFFRKKIVSLCKIIWQKKILVLIFIMFITIIVLSFIIFQMKTSFTGAMGMNKNFKKLIVLGIDGFDYKIISHLIKSNELPNFKQIATNGTFQALTPTIPPQSPVSWSTLATGLNPGGHNIFDFISRDPKNYLPKLSILQRSPSGLSEDEFIKVMLGKAFWQKTSEAHISTNIIRWPITFPAERINGNMLSGLGVPEIGGLLNSYTYYSSNSKTKTSGLEEKLIVIEKKNNKIETVIHGPQKKDMFKTSQISVPMNITISEDSILIHVEGKEYKVKLNNWSNWMRVSFKVGLLKSITSIFKVYLESIEPDFKMYMTSLQVDPENPAYKISNPQNFSNKLSSSIGLFYTLGMPEDTQALEDGAISDKTFLQQCNEITEERKKMFWHEFNALNEGILGFVFDASDRIQHMFWRNNKMNHNYEILELSLEIKNHYIEMDHFIGEILDKKTKDTALVIFSDHGFTSFDYQIDLNRWLVENDYMQLSGPPDTKNWGALFQNVNWKETQAYAVGFSGIYINVKGREGKGIVEKDKVNELKKEIIEKLSGMKDKQGQKVIYRAYNREEIYEGPYTKNAPDIIIGYNPGYRTSWQTAIGGVYKSTISQNEKKWRGDHIVDPKHVPGIFLSSEKLNLKENLHAKDISSLILKLSGLD